MKIVTKGQSHYHFIRNPKQSNQVTVQITTHDRCSLPFQFILGKTAMGQSLVREIFLKGTSSFFLETLHQLQILDKEKIC